MDDALNQNERAALSRVNVLAAGDGILDAAGEELFAIVSCYANGHQRSVAVVGSLDLAVSDCRAKIQLPDYYTGLLKG